MKCIGNAPGDKEEELNKEWAVRPYYKRELAEAYAPGIAPTSALNRLSKWLNLNKELHDELANAGYKNTQKIFTSRQVGIIFRHLGRP